VWAPVWAEGTLAQGWLELGCGKGRNGIVRVVRSRWKTNQLTDVCLTMPVPFCSDDQEQAGGDGKDAH
jgi:hypothetical protein